MMPKHRDPKTVMRYNHVRENLDQSAVNFLGYDGSAKSSLEAATYPSIKNGAFPCPWERKPKPIPSSRDCSPHNTPRARRW